jgi:oligoribonuclease NrnB/cAMP/cGMP phosphodiesterase (DHH superfamily)
MGLKLVIEQARDYLSPQEVECVVYHAPCNDGFGAALSAWVLWGEQIIYKPMIYHENFEEEILRGKKVVVLDASFKKERLNYLRTICTKIMILDHHYSAMQDLKDEEGCFFEMHNSGAILAWHYFHGITTKAPKLLELIEDRDLWRWSQRDLSEPLYYGIRKRCDEDFRSLIPYLAPDQLDELIAYGQTLVEMNKLWCINAALNTHIRDFIHPDIKVKYRIACGEIANSNLVSELSEYLYTQHKIDFVMLWSKTPEKKYRINFRSNNPNIDVSKIAVMLGGGGHKQAAGAMINISPWDLISKN